MTRPRTRGRHRKERIVSRIASRHGRRLMSFSLIGFGVFVLGIFFQTFLVRALHVPAVPAYVTQLVLSVQLNFLANFKWTWSDRKAPFWRSCWRYNIKRAGGTLLSLALYPLLVRLGMNYLIANGLLVVLLTPANYILGHFWTFASARPERASRVHEERSLQLEYH
jgi:putative flippase GtrA